MFMSPIDRHRRPRMQPGIEPLEPRTLLCHLPAVHVVEVPEPAQDAPGLVKAQQANHGRVTFSGIKGFGFG